MKILFLGVCVLLVMSEVLARSRESSEGKSSKMEKDADSSKADGFRGKGKNSRRVLSELLAKLRPWKSGKYNVCSSNQPCAGDSCCVGSLHQNTRKGRCQPVGKLHSPCLASNERREGMKKDQCQCGPDLSCVTDGSIDEGVCRQTCSDGEDCPDGYCCLRHTGDVSVCTPRGLLEQACLVSNIGNPVRVREGSCQCHMNLTCVAEADGDAGVCKPRPCGCVEGQCCTKTGSKCFRIPKNGEGCLFRSVGPQTDIYSYKCPCDYDLSCNPADDSPFGKIGGRCGPEEKTDTSV